MFDKFDKAYLKIIQECGDSQVNECDNINECGDAQVNECDDDIKTESKKENSKKVVTFFTEDPELIDALNSGFNEVVFFVNTTDEDGNDTVKEVKISPDGLEELSVEDAPVDPEDDEAEDIDDEFNESITGAAGGAIAGGLMGGPLGAVAGGLLGSNL